MAGPEEFTIHIEPDGRIVFDGRGMHETAYRRILELLEETMGPVQHLEAELGDPPSRHLAATPEARKRNQQELDRKRS